MTNPELALRREVGQRRERSREAAEVEGERPRNDTFAAIAVARAQTSGRSQLVGGCSGMSCRDIDGPDLVRETIGNKSLLSTYVNSSGIGPRLAPAYWAIAGSTAGCDPCLLSRAVDHFHPWPRGDFFLFCSF
jgi:hypothetical protein